MLSDRLDRLERNKSPRLAAEPDRGASSLIRIGWITAWLAGLSIAVSIFQAPNQTLVRFAAADSGGELVIQDLIGRGFRPGIDFGYPYGLLALLFGRAWYGLAGLSPRSFEVYVSIGTVLSCWGLARFAVYRRVGLTGLVLIALAIPDLLLVTYVTSVQTIEQVLLIHALAEQSRGRRGAALALLTACCFVKPSLAFVQGLAVVIAVVASGRGAVVRSLVPPLITAVVLAAILAVAFGPLSLAMTLSPATGAAIYRAGHFGFFHGQGREFWVLPNAGLRDYFRYEVGFWMLGTASLMWGGISGLWRLSRGIVSAEKARDDEINLTCAVIHLVFVTMLFGHRWTWVYSLPMLIMGLAVLANRGPRHRLGVWVLAVLLLVSDRSKMMSILQRRETESPSSATLGLWTTPQEREEWTRVLELARGQRPALFSMCDGGALLLPGFAPPIVAYLVPGNPRPIEVERKAQQLAGASMIISAHPVNWDGFRYYPRLKTAFDGCELIYEGRSLRVYRRRPPAGIPVG